MMDVFGVWNEEIDSLPDGVKNSVAVNGRSYDAFELCARIHPITAEVLGTYEKDFYAGEPAVTKNRFGSGAAYYIAARTGTDLLADLYSEMISGARHCAGDRRRAARGCHGARENRRKRRRRVCGKLQQHGGNGGAAGAYELYGTGERVNSIKLAPFGVARVYPN